MRTIRVTGKGQLKVHPDMTRITMELKGGSREYGETLEKSAKETEQLKDILAPFGFDRTDLKTLRFDVETLYESYQEKKVGEAVGFEVFGDGFGEAVELAADPIFGHAEGVVMQ